MEYTKHFNEMLGERNIRQSRIEQAVRNPDHTESREDGRHTSFHQTNPGTQEPVTPGGGSFYRS